MSDCVKCMQTLETYLENFPHSCYPILQYMNHLVSIAQTLGDSPAKSFLLKEAEFYEEEIELSVKRFIAKRLYAFSKKQRLNCVQERLQCFPDVAFQPSVEILLKVLSFDNLSRNDFIMRNPPKPEVQENQAENSVRDNTVVVTQKKDKPTTEKHATKKRSRRLQKTKQEKIDYLTPSTNTRRSIAEIQKEKSLQIENDWKVLKKWQVNPINCKAFAKALRKELPEKPYPHLLKFIEGFMRHLKDKEEKYALMRVKHALLTHQKLVEKPRNLMVVINYGNSGIDLLKQAANITTDKKINAVFYEYFLTILKDLLTRHKTQFRRAIESCYDRHDLYELMAQYPLKNKTYIEEFDLHIIDSIKQICHGVDKGKDFETIANKFLGNTEANIKKALYVSLFESPVTNKIWDAMRKAQSTYQFFQCLKQLKEIPETEKMASTIFQLVVTFLRGGKKISFRDLEISLNFTPNNLRNHAIRIISRKLQNDVDYKMETFLSQNISMERKWKKLLQLLQNSQFEGAKIKVFGYSPDDLLAILRKIESSEGDIRKVVEHEFHGEDVSLELKELIIEKHSQQHKKKEKNLQNFYEELMTLTSEKVLSLRRPLIDLLRVYGSVNLTSDGSTLTGYELSNTISMFYRDAARTKIVLPNNLHYQIAVLIEDSINEERARQLSKVFADN
ncbi:hypothetical protein [Candidatus Uabimicrobium amorphum]|uniref:Uncharacterized protein n=1 Tax=Uabimicrobium amorphum TaxID=2596890 RepID=A0A5S9IT42_UABAM|nr:hypothetical protein [Candidatus Uabimicrobium amorphum]BBM87658.1 hypothetical protein UABAM_06070 [Candidatus Uabimicrobium amorphum]